MTANPNTLIRDTLQDPLFKGKAWRWCPACKFDMEVTDHSESIELFAADCPDCDSGRVWDEERFKSAVLSWLWPIAYLDDGCIHISKYGGYMSRGETLQHFWDGRTEYEFGPILTDHVHNWTADPPDFLTAMNPDDPTELLLERVLWDAKWSVEIHKEPEDRDTPIARVCSPCDRYESDWTGGKNTAAALLAAVEAAITKGETDD